MLSLMAVQEWLAGILEKLPGVGRVRCFHLVRLLDVFAVTGFWLTMAASYYYGLYRVLPSLYGDYPPWLMTAHTVIVNLTFVEMVINWIFTRAVQSLYDPKQHEEKEREEKNAPSGIVIDVERSMVKGENGRRTISREFFRKIGADERFFAGSLYVVDMKSDDKAMEKGEKPCGSQKMVFPYWSWKPCSHCGHTRPPRAHHCPICSRCVMKRDHHCFFVGACVGVRNQRFFYVFIFWSVVATTYSIIHTIVYVFAVHGPAHTHWDLLLPVTLIRWLLGYLPGHDTAIFLTLYALVWFGMTTLGFFQEQTKCITRGISGFEFDHKIKIINSNSTQANWEGVFGRYWWLNFALPVNILFKTVDNGVNWPSIKTKC